MTIHRLKENSLLTQFRCHRVVYSYSSHKDLYDALTCTWNILGFDIASPSVLRGHKNLKHNFFSWKNCLLASIVLMTSHVSPQCFPSQKIQTGSLFSLSYQCFSLFGRTPPLSPGASSTLCLFNHCWRLFIKDSISQFSQFSSVCTISDLTCGTLLRVDIANPLSIWASPMHCQQHIVVSGHALVKFLNLQVIGSFDDRKVHYFFYVCVHNKFALAILGFQSFPGYLVANFTRLQVCYLCSYV